MGPRSGDRGNRLRDHVAAIAAAVLQWGRDLEIAEILRWADGIARNIARLQWGRDLEIAEMTPATSARSRSTRSFNGAAIWRSRK